MKNYYEILEINEKASQEVIERVYKLLAKRYHPDMNMDNPKEAEEKFKEISAAYEILSDPKKRKEYDEELQNEKQKEEMKQKSNNAQNSNDYFERNTNTTTINKKEAEDFDQDELKYRKEFIKNMARQQAIQEQEMQQAYNDAYYKALEDMGYTIIYKKTFRDYLSIFLTIVIIAVILFVLWLIPPIQSQLIEIYENSGPIKDIIETIIKAIKK